MTDPHRDCPRYLRTLYRPRRRRPLVITRTVYRLATLGLLLGAVAASLLTHLSHAHR